MPVLNDTPGYQLDANDIKSIFNIRTKTGVYTAKYNDMVLCDTTDGAFTITLPTVSLESKGAWITVYKVDSSVNTITIATKDSAHINGTDTVSLTNQYESYTIVNDGLNWYII